MITNIIINHYDNKSIHLKLDKIMAEIDILKTEVAGLKTDVEGLQTSLDAEQEQIAALLATNAQVVTDLNTQIAALQEQLANSPNPAAIQEIIDSVTATRNSIATSKADLEGTVADTLPE